MGSLEHKKQVVEEIAEHFRQSQSVVIIEYRSLTVADITDLRAKLRNAGANMKVYKNTLVKIAADTVGLQGLEQQLQGPTAWVFSKQDPVAGPKILLEFEKTNKNLVIKGGVIENNIINAKAVTSLAELPSREVLLAQVLGAIQSPLAGMANVLQGPIRKFGYVLEDLRKKKESA